MSSSLAPSSDPSTPPQNLRDHILDALASHPGTREFHVHALVSAPRRTGDLFPFATPRAPRVWMQDVLVLLSEQPLDGSAARNSGGNGNGTGTGNENADDGEPPRPSTPPPKSERPPRILVSAVEAALYIVPSTACGILYVSKVDSTGYASAPSPTARLVRAVLSYFINPATRPSPARQLVKHLYVHIFARAQAQYLFSASADWEGKKPLGDRGLCAWWRRVLGRVAGEVVEKNQKANEKEGKKEGEKKKVEEEEGLKVKMYHILPGFGALEAEHALRNAAPTGTAEVTLPAGLQWVYGHPYSQMDGTPLPCPQPPAQTDVEEADGLKRKNGYGSLNLGCIIPSFDDDPKSRFMDEIAYTTDGDLKSPQRKRARTAVEVVGRATASGSNDALPAIGSVLARPKNSSSLEARGKDGRNIEEGGGSVPVIVVAEKEKERERPLGELGKVTPDEFWERMSFRQECVAGAVTGFFTLVVSTSGRGEGEGTGAVGTAAVLGPQAGQVSGQVHKRILTTLLTGVEFSTAERAAKATETVEGAIRGLCEGGPVPVARERERLLEVPKTPPRRRGVPMEVTPNPFPEAVASATTYGEWVYGRAVTRNAVGGRAVAAGPAVRELAVRRKKKAI